MLNFNAIAKACILTCGLTVATIASATPFVTGDIQIDFRDSAWSSPTNPMTVGEVTVTANPSDRNLTWYSDDGLGISGGIENDEIDGPTEFMNISFSTNYTTSPVNGISGFWLSDLFDQSGLHGSTLNDGGADGEDGYAVITLVNGTVLTETFNGNNSDQSVSIHNNGEQYVQFANALQIANISFYAGGTGSVIVSGDDYSVIGFTTVPEPMAVMLMGLGILGLGLTRRQK